jgi:hypothetical protein
MRPRVAKPSFSILFVLLRHKRRFAHLLQLFSFLLPASVIRFAKILLFAILLTLGKSTSKSVKHNIRLF